MSSLEQIKSAIKAQIKKELAVAPLMDVDAVKAELLAWLAECKLPSGCQATSWADLVQVYPVDPQDREAKSGARMRLALRLSTRENQYLISIMECLKSDSRGIYLISVHVNWKLHEQQLQRLVEESYRGHFDDVLRARHALWAQTFRDGELGNALSSCAKAVLSNELVARKPQDIAGEKMRLPHPAAAQFPKTDES